jgi:hypothetical protein
MATLAGIMPPRSPDDHEARSFPAYRSASRFTEKNFRWRFPSADIFGGTDTIQPDNVSTGSNSGSFGMAEFTATTATSQSPRSE